MGEKAGLDAIESASRDELESLQMRWLEWSLRHAYENVPAYRRKCEAWQIHPDDLRAVDDLARFPFTTKDDLRAAYPFGMFAVPREAVVRVHASSGTTGHPTVVGYTEDDLETWAQLVARSIYAAGGRPGDILHNAYGYGLFTGGLGFHRGAERLGCTCVPVSGGMTERQIQLILDFRPDIISVTPSYLLAISDGFERRGLDARDTSLRIAMLGAEPWTEPMRHEIEDHFGLDTLNHYGLSEVIGPGVASECVETKDGLTLWEDHFIPEIVDPDTGEPSPGGKVGELVLTTLTKVAMPVIRFRTRDLSRLLPPSARSMRRCERISGRSDDVLIIRGVNVFPSQLEALVLGCEGLSPHYVIEVRSAGRMDDLTLVVEARRDSAATESSPPDESAGALASEIKSRLGLSAKVRVTAPGSIERSAGKAQRVVDLRGSTD